MNNLSKIVLEKPSIQQHTTMMMMKQMNE